MKAKLAFLIMLLTVTDVDSHGRLLMPPQRSSMWRYKFDVPPNYTDHGLNCGGSSYQWNTKGGKCGFCGDPYGAANPNNQDGGQYDTGIIGQEYHKGQSIHVIVQLTANHKGWFEFRLCESRELTDECFNKHLLHITSTTDLRYYPGTLNGNHTIELQLPQDVTCSNCVLQWKYNAGNNWGCNAPKDCCIGCGPQEQFINCADIRIRDTDVTTKPSTKSVKTEAATTESAKTTTHAETTESSKRTSPAATSTPTKKTCVSLGPFSSLGGMDAWCTMNCNMGRCPSFICKCDGEIRYVIVPM